MRGRPVRPRRWAAYAFVAALVAATFSPTFAAPHVAEAASTFEPGPPTLSGTLTWSDTYDDDDGHGATGHTTDQGQVTLHLLRDDEAAGQGDTYKDDGTSSWSGSFTDAGALAGSCSWSVSGQASGTFPPHQGTDAWNPLVTARYPDEVDNAASIYAVPTGEAPANGDVCGDQGETFPVGSPCTVGDSTVVHDPGPSEYVTLDCEYSFTSDNGQEHGHESAHGFLMPSCVPAAGASRLSMAAAEAAATPPTCGLVPLFTWKRVSDKIEDYGKVDFDASGSTDSGSAIRTYLWDWGDGASDDTGAPDPEHTYQSRGSAFAASMHFEDAGGHQSANHVETVQTCPQGGVTAILPAINQSYDRILKPIGVKYDEIAVTFRAQKTAAGDATCSFRGSGILPVRIRLMSGYDRSLPTRKLPDVVVRSYATAQLDFLAGGSSVPNCHWSVLSTHPITDCVVGGSGSTLVRWHTDGFSERLGSDELYNSGPMTYYARVSPSSTYQDAIREIEPMLHTILTHNLDSMRSFYAIQDPPAHISVTDSSGRTTGVTSKGKKVEQIPGSAYFTHRSFSGILLMLPSNGRYIVRVSQKAKSRFKLSMALINLEGAMASRTRDIRKSGVVSKHHVRRFCLKGGRLC